MTDRFRPGRISDWVVFCDICGQKCYASEAKKLSQETGRGGLIVCPNDADYIDFGLIPYKPPTERPIPFARYDDETANGSEPEDPETSTDLGT